MLEIDLTKQPVYWATIEKNKDRHLKMESMFKNLNFENTHQIDGEISNPYTVGIAQSHIDALSNSLPLIVMEDDCSVTKNWTSTINIPKGTDAVYLGTSWFGMIRDVSTYRGCISSVYDSNFNKVYNMLGIHSILYLSERYKDHVIKTLKEFQENPGTRGCDEPIALTMKNFNILALKNPLFYQEDGHSDQETITPLQPLF
tara:strand:+ start:147 stop:749 length:603 start_codon:yes stop_codon:yes gene_type:complete